MKRGETGPTPFVKRPFKDGQALLRPLAQLVVAMACFLLPRVELIGNRQRTELNDSRQLLRNGVLGNWV